MVRILNSNIPTGVKMIGVRSMSYNMDNFKNSLKDINVKDLKVDGVQKLTQFMLTNGLDRKSEYWPFTTAKDLAKEYKLDISYENDEARAKDVVLRESSKSFASGFVTGLGGVLALPVGLPAAFLASLTLQTRLSGTVAEVFGHDTQSEEIRTKILLTLVPSDSKLKDSLKDELHKHLDEDSKKELVLYDKSALADGVQNKAVDEFGIHRLPIATLTTANHIVAHVIKQGASRASGRMIPFFGGFLGGSVDAWAAYRTGMRAIETFKHLD